MIWYDEDENTYYCDECGNTDSGGGVWYDETTEEYWCEDCDSRDASFDTADTAGLD